jgi:hypothetical protein
MFPCAFSERGKGGKKACFHVLSVKGGKGEMGKMAETRESDHPEILFLG